MRIPPSPTLFIAAAATITALVFAGDRLPFDLHVLLSRPTPAQYGDAMPEPPEVRIECDKPDCDAGSIGYEVVVDGTGRPRAIRFDGEFLPDASGRPRFTHFNTPTLEPSRRTKAAKAALAARWPAPESSRAFRAFQVVEIVPPERLPTRHVPFPETEGQAVSITLERTIGFGPYAPYDVTIDSDGNVDFCGPSYIQAPGPHRSHISRAAFEALVQEFRKADFFSMDDRYVDNATDGAAYYLRVRIGDEEKTVVDYYGYQVGMPRVITRLQTAVDEAAETSRWIGPADAWVSRGDWADCPRPLSRATG